jgi:hypothetical protein
MTVPVRIYSSCDYIQIGFHGKPHWHSFTKTTHAPPVASRDHPLPLKKNARLRAAVPFEQAMNRARVARALLQKTFRSQDFHPRALQGAKSKADIAKRRCFFPMRVNCRGTPT